MSAPSSEIPPVADIDPEGDVIIVLLDITAKEAAIKQDPPAAESPGSQSTQTTPVEAIPRARFRVCAKHLCLASAYFKSRLGGRWSEGQELARNKSVELSLSGFDVEAVRIILNIIHGRSRQVPLSVEYQLMTGLTRLTDYLQCQEIVEPFGKHWVTPGTTLPAKMTDQIPVWIMASICFRHAGACGHTTQIAQQCGTKPFDPGFLSIPKDYITSIRNSREAYLENVFKLLRQRFAQLKDGPVTCNMGCDAMYLGLFMKFNAGDKLPFTQIPKPYTGYSASYVHDVLSEWESKLHYTCLPKWKSKQPCLNREQPLGKELSKCLEEMDSTLNGYALPQLG